MRWCTECTSYVLRWYVYTYMYLRIHVRVAGNTAIAHLATDIGSDINASITCLLRGLISLLGLFKNDNVHNVGLFTLTCTYIRIRTMHIISCTFCNYNSTCTCNSRKKNCEGEPIICTHAIIHIHIHVRSWTILCNIFLFE